MATSSTGTRTAWPAGRTRPGLLAHPWTGPHGRRLASTPRARSFRHDGQTSVAWRCTERRLAVHGASPGGAPSGSRGHRLALAIPAPMDPPQGGTEPLPQERIGDRLTNGLDAFSRTDHRSALRSPQCLFCASAGRSTKRYVSVARTAVSAHTSARFSTNPILPAKVRPSL
jgi:hypothetical protein